MPNEAHMDLGKMAAEASAAKWRWAERWLSKPRLDSYLSFCEGDIDLALELHEWNISLGKVLMGDIAHFEVAIRNAYNRVLEENFKSDKHWLLDESSPVVRPILRNSKTKKLRDVNLMNRKAISDAERRAHDPTDPVV